MRININRCNFRCDSLYLNVDISIKYFYDLFFVSPIPKLSSPTNLNKYFESLTTSSSIFLHFQIQRLIYNLLDEKTHTEISAIFDLSMIVHFLFLRCCISNSITTTCLLVVGSWNVTSFSVFSPAASNNRAH